MIIAKPEWFKRRKYTGWGATPKDWRGYLYVAIVIGIFVAFQALPFWSTTLRIIGTIAWILFLFIDHLDIIFNIGKDERERKHEAIAERNALWAIVIVLSLGLVYQIILSGLKQKLLVDPILAIALILGLIFKAISNIYLDKKD